MYKFSKNPLKQIVNFPIEKRILKKMNKCKTLQHKIGG